MAEVFSLAPQRCAVLSDPSLREEIMARTESREATEQILRSLRRFGVDPTIERFDVAPQAVRATVRIAATVAWSVKAVRAARVVVPPTA